MVLHEGTSEAAIALPLKQESKVLRREMHHHQHATPSRNTTHNPSQSTFEARFIPKPGHPQGMFTVRDCIYFDLYIWIRYKNILIYLPFNPL